MAIGERELLEYACEKFENEQYEEALEAFILAYSKGIEQEWVIENIYNCYLEGNENEFRRTYEQQAVDAEIGYEDCILDFVPYKEGEYYIFDKVRSVFCGIFSVNDFMKTETDLSLQNAEYSAAVLAMEWDWKKEKVILSEAKKRKIYVVSCDIRRCVSFCKIPELAEYTKNIKIFASEERFQDYFHENTSVYLPKIICGSQEQKLALNKIIDEEHQYRLTPKGRNIENILLTIGIPTHERGNLVLKRLKNLLSMPYDAEIEIAISKNGMKRYQKEYEEISKIEDARVCYYDHGAEIMPTINWMYVVEMAHGEYVLIVSDEDDVVVASIEHYLKLLSDHPDLSLVRAKTRFQCPIERRIYAKKGVEAFRCEFTKQNYLSGMIVRREDFLQEGFLKLQKYADNSYYQYYPHEWWCAFLSQRGDYVEEPCLLIDEQECVAGEEARLAQEEVGITSDEEIWGDMYVPDFGTYKERLRQFKGQMELLHLLCGQNKEMIESGLQNAIGKAAWLFELARGRNYDCKNYLNMIDQYVSHCIEAIEEFELEKEQKKRLLRWTEYCCEDMYNEHIRLNGGYE